VIWVNVNKPTTKPILVNSLDEDGKEYKVEKLDADGIPVKLKSGKISMTTAKRRETATEYAARLEELIKADPDKYISTASVKRSVNDIFNTLEDNSWTVGLIEVLKKTVEDELWPRHSGHCEKWNKMCRFAEVCNVTDQDEIARAGFIKREHRHAELDNDEAGDLDF
jgi:hypothetical protein